VTAVVTTAAVIASSSDTAVEYPALSVCQFRALQIRAHRYVVVNARTA
jgi:hypothetical protein